MYFLSGEARWLKRIPVEAVISVSWGIGTGCRGEGTARWLFWAYVALMAATIVVAGALLHHPDRRAFTAAALVALFPLVGYILSRTTGLPGADDDIGNWTDPLGLASLWVEGAVALTAGYALAPRSVRAPARPLKIGPLET